MILRKLKELGAYSTCLVSFLFLTLDGEFNLMAPGEYNIGGCLFEVDANGDIQMSLDNNTDTFLEINSEGDIQYKEGV